MTKICLELKNITKSFTKEDAVLNGINLTIHKGEFITLLGSSGCGKTTTLRIVAGLEMPDFGQVFLDGEDVTLLAPEARDVNTVFQNGINCNWYPIFLACSGRDFLGIQTFGNEPYPISV